MKKQVTKLIAKYDKIENNIDKIEKQEKEDYNIVNELFKNILREMILLIEL